MPDQNVTSPRQLEDQVWRCVDQGNIEQALKMCAHLNQEFPDYAPGWRSQSHLAQRLKNYTGALKAIEKAVQLEPASAEWLLQKCYCLMQLGRRTDALPLAKTLAGVELANAYQYANLALILSRLELHAQAAEKYLKAIELEPGASQHYYNLATVQRFLGDFETAEASLASAIKVNPQDYEAYKLRSDLRRQTPDHNHIEELRSLLSKGAPEPRAEIDLRFALAKELEDVGEYTEAFASLQAGATQRRRLMRYDVHGDVETMAKIAQVYGAEQFSDAAGLHEGGQPIFVLGMPRTGTTLVERILDSHSRVTSLGELNDFAIQLTRAVRQVMPGDAKPPSKIELVERSIGVDFEALGRAYLQSANMDSSTGDRFVDKMPLNFLYVGLIHKALPQARIVHLRRHPLDTCFAIYKTLFKDAYPFSYSLAELGAYYLAYEQLMRHWQAVLPGVVYNIGYEALVRNTEAEVRSLLEYCQLPWDDNCLRFYENRTASTTASASQVREPVYASSVGNWRNYAEQLQPLVDLLKNAGVDLADR